MFLERLGQILFSKMRPTFFFLLTLLPLILTGILILGKRLEISTLENQYESTILRASNSLDKRSRKEQFLSQHTSAEPYFLDQNIESLTLLRREIDLLTSCQNHPALADKYAIERRLSYLTEKNRISFVEEDIRTTKGCKETDEKMRKAVEADESDIKKLLALIENLPIGSFEPSQKSPQLIITDFHLKKKPSPLEQEIFEVRFNLLKREFTKS